MRGTLLKFLASGLGALLMSPASVFADNVEITLPTADATSGFLVKKSDLSSLLHLKADGVLQIATMTEEQRLALRPVVAGTIVFQSNGTAGLYFHTGSQWLSAQPSMEIGNGSITNTHLSTDGRHTQTITTTPLTGTTQLTSEDGAVLVSAIYRDITLTLPSAANLAGRTYTIKLVRGPYNAIITSKDSSGNAELIERGTSTTLNAPGDYIHLISNGGQWVVLERQQTPDNTVVIETSGSYYTSPIDAMANLSNWCGTPSSSNECTIILGPGNFNFEGTSLNMTSYVNVVGSGKEETILSGTGDAASSGVVIGASHSEIRDLAIQATGTNSSTHALYIDQKSFDAKNVFLYAASTEAVPLSITGGSSQEIQLEDVTVFGGGTAFKYHGTSGAKRVEFLRSEIGSMAGTSSDANGTAKPAVEISGEGDVEMYDSRVFGGDKALYLSSLTGTSEQRISLRNTLVSSYSSEAILIESTTSAGGLDISHSTLMSPYKALRTTSSTFSVQVSHSSLGAYGSSAESAIVTSNGNMRISHSEVSGNQSGIYLLGSATVEVFHSKVSGINSYAVNLDSGTFKAFGAQLTRYGVSAGAFSDSDGGISSSNATIFMTDSGKLQVSNSMIQIGVLGGTAGINKSCLSSINEEFQSVYCN